ncbi:MAG: PEP-CTERM sorting domain-containing protein [bacterium]
MRRWLSFASVAMALTLPIGVAAGQEQVIGFEGLSTQAALPGYMGFTWSTGFNEWAIATASGFSSLFRPSSGQANAVSDEMSYISFSRPEFFNLNSMFLGEFLPPGRSEFANTMIYGYRGGDLVYSMDVDYNLASMSKVDFDWTNVDKVSIAAVKGRVLVDDISVTSTPEPATVALVGTGLLGLFLFRRRKAQARITA